MTSASPLSLILADVQRQKLLEQAISDGQLAAGHCKCSKQEAQGRDLSPV
jgi:hypothetical protein